MFLWKVIRKTTGFGLWEKVIELFQEIKGKHNVYVEVTASESFIRPVVKKL